MHFPKTMSKFQSKRVAGTLAAISAVFLVSGCFGSSPVNLPAGAGETEDSCGQFHAIIAEAKAEEAREQQDAAMIGAAVGAIFGAFAANDGSEFEGALLGATAGSLVGASATYYQQKAKNAADSQALLASVNGDASEELALVTRTGQAAEGLRNCRMQQVADLTAKINQGEISRPDAQGQLELIKSRVAVDNEVISLAFNGISERVTAYVDATNAVTDADEAITVAYVKDATPDVARVETQRVETVNLDTARREQLDSDIGALELLLG
ncbi:MAG: hypothetical protein OXI87_06010 [Albidovulum sp.]|nr:hypothetical protein [Albidovulum sp.]